MRAAHGRVGVPFGARDGMIGRIARGVEPNPRHPLSAAAGRLPAGPPGCPLDPARDPPLEA